MIRRAGANETRFACTYNRLWQVYSGAVATSGGEASAIFPMGCYWPISAHHDRQRLANNGRSQMTAFNRPAESN